MAIHQYTFSSNVPINANAANDVYLIRSNVFIATTGAAVDGINAAGSKKFLVYGNLIADGGDAVALGLNGTGGFNSVYVFEGGSLFSEFDAIDSNGGSLRVVNDGSIIGLSNAIETTFGGTRVINRGSINGQNSAVEAVGGHAQVINYGSMEGLGSTINLFGADGLVINHGDIVTTSLANHPAVRLIPGSGESARFENFGTVSGEFAFRGEGGDETVINHGTLQGHVTMKGGADRLVNRGTIDGDVALGTGNDHFDNRGGILVGQAADSGGDDVYLIDNADITIVEPDNDGTDLVGSSVSFALPGGVENLSLTGSDGIFGIGNELDNLITPNAGANFIDGGAGIDTVSYGQAGTGVVIKLFGSFDFGAVMPPTYIGVIDPNEIAEFNEELAAAAGTGGAAGDILLNVENLFGSSSNDMLVGYEGNNLLRGQGGDDALFGLQGDDVLEGGAGADNLLGGAGTNFASYANAGTGLVADLIVTTNNTGDAAGDFYKSIHNLRGSQHDDTLLGTFGTNRVEGLAGDDKLQGRGGGDTYLGGLGNDTFIFQTGFALETVLDFDALNDAEKINLQNVSGITDFLDLTNNHLTESGGDSLISDGSGVLRLVGVASADLGPGDFIF